MTRLQKLYKDNDREFLKFEHIPEERRYSERPDLNAFILLDKIFACNRNIIVSAEHDEIWLDVDVEILDEVATDEQLLDLLRCGVRAESEGLAMFV